jgi:N-succinyldiaminopimelate aminotransferase
MKRLRATRLSTMPNIGVDRMGAAADALSDPEVLRLENMDTDLRPDPAALEAARGAVGEDVANSYLPFAGSERLRRAAAAHVSRLSGIGYDWRECCVVSAGGCNGILNLLLAILEPGDEVILTDPIYVGLMNRVRLAGGVPRLAPLVATADGWRLDLDAFRAAAESPRVRAVLMVSPSMPTGAVLSAEEWNAVAEACVSRNLLLINDAAMERILFDGRRMIHPAGLPGMAERTVTVGTASKELRMIGWRVGWVVGPAEIVKDVGLVCIANTVCQVGIAMESVAVALEAGDEPVALATAEWQARRDVMLEELRGVAPAITPHGGWSMLLDVGSLGLRSADASTMLMKQAKIAATPMINWGSESADRYVRFVFANEPREQLRGMGERVRKALRS